MGARCACEIMDEIRYMYGYSLNLFGAFLGLILITTIEYIKYKVRNGPLGEFYALYARNYIFVAEGGILLLATSFLWAILRLHTTFPLFDRVPVHEVLMVGAMACFAYSGKIFLGEVERMIRHRQKEKEALAKELERVQ